MNTPMYLKLFISPHSDSDIKEKYVQAVKKHNKKELAKILSGNFNDKNMNTFAQAYAGHQFGHFTMLGDGRAVLIGEHLSKNKDRYDIQFKGSGKTAFSRNGEESSKILKLDPPG